MKLRVLIIFCLFALVGAGCSLPKLSLFPEDGPMNEKTLQGSSDDKIWVLSINGTISTKGQERLLRSRPSMVQQVVTQLKRAEQDPSIKVLLLKVNSPGGSVTASDILYHEISAYKQRTGVKVVVAMMNVAASGGYYISLPADWIVAHPTTVTGSIGVIFARPGVSGFMEKAGFSMEVSTSGELKDMGSPFRPPTDKEAVIFQELTDTLAQRFLDLVTLHRKLQPAQREKVASARIYLADDAKRLGLVDQIGYLNDAVDKAIAMGGLGSDARVVTYRRSDSEEITIYNPSGHQQARPLDSAIPVLTPGRTISEAGFYYLWPSSI